MTAGFRRWTRRRKPNDLSNRLATIRRHRSENLGSVENDLLGEDRFREMVALALLLILSQALIKNKSQSEIQFLPERILRVVTRLNGAVGKSE